MIFLETAGDFHIDIYVYCIYGLTFMLHFYIYNYFLSSHGTVTCGFATSFVHKVIHKVRTLRFRNLRASLSSYTCLYVFSLHLLRPSTSVRILLFKEDVKEIYFLNYYQSKKHKQLYKIEKLLCNAIRKYRIKTSRRPLGIKVALSNCTGKMGMDNFSCLDSLYFIFIL